MSDVFKKCATRGVKYLWNRWHSARSATFRAWRHRDWRYCVSCFRCVSPPSCWCSPRTCPGYLQQSRAPRWQHSSHTCLGAMQCNKYDNNGVTILMYSEIWKHKQASHDATVTVVHKSILMIRAQKEERKPLHRVSYVGNFLIVSIFMSRKLI